LFLKNGSVLHFFPQQRNPQRLAEMERDVKRIRSTDLIEKSKFGELVWFLLSKEQQSIWRCTDESSRSYSNPDAQSDLFSVASVAALATGPGVLPAI
jgi:hypothetical protein